MAGSSDKTPRLDHFFSASAARLDQWRELNAQAQTWAAETRSNKPAGGRAAVEAALAVVTSMEDFFAYPGTRLMKRLAERVAADDAVSTARLVRRMSAALLSGSYRYDSSDSDLSDEGATGLPDRLPGSLEGPVSHRPYFETLFVTPAPAASIPKIADEIRRLRRAEDVTVYEPVLVGSF